MIKNSKLPSVSINKKSKTSVLSLLMSTVLLSVFFPVSAFAQSNAKPLKVFILAGQSNMQGHADVSTIDYIGDDPKTAPMLLEMRDKNGKYRLVKDTWISYLTHGRDTPNGEGIGQLTVGFGARKDPTKDGGKIGPEFTFGIYVQKSLKQPILIIKAAWGGKSLHTDFRPPSAGPYQFNDTQLEGFKKQDKDIEKVKADKAKVTGHYYRLIIDHVKKVLANIKRIYPDYDPKAGYELAGFVWFQGWNDMVDRSTYPNRGKPGGYDTYSELLAQFIRDVRKDLSAPKLPFVIGVMGVGGPVEKYPPEQIRYKGIHHNFRMAMAAPAALPEFKGNVMAVLTEKYWDIEVVELREREKKIKQEVDEVNNKMKEGKLSREEGKAALDKFYAKTFTPREMGILKKSTSNFDFHYMGSVKIMAQIGKSFAEALVEMMEGHNHV